MANKVTPAMVGFDLHSLLDHFITLLMVGVFFFVHHMTEITQFVAFVGITLKVVKEIRDFWRPRQ